VWPNPLDLGADLMTMSTYKSLGGPAGGLLLTNRADLAERVDKIAYPGLTANFDAGKTASLAITLLDWLDGGREYATEKGPAKIENVAPAGFQHFVQPHAWLHDVASVRR
jgi:glycine hydroxymethyltransferase